jgi:hypothetical protein
VKAAQKAAAFEDQENETVVVKEKMVGGIAQVSHLEGYCQEGSHIAQAVSPAFCPNAILADLSFGPPSLR